MSELPMMNTSGIIIRAGSIFLGGKCAESHQFSLGYDSCVPAPRLFIKRHPFEATNRISVARRVALILLSRAKSEIAAPTVKRIAVNMIDFLKGWGIHQHSVKVDVSLRTLKCCIPLVVAGIRSAPSLRQDKNSVGAVDQGNFTFGQEDKRDTIGTHSVLQSLTATPGLLQQCPASPCSIAKVAS